MHITTGSCSLDLETLQNVKIIKFISCFKNEQVCKRCFGAMQPPVSGPSQRMLHDNFKTFDVELYGGDAQKHLASDPVMHFYAAKSTTQAMKRDCVVEKPVWSRLHES